MKTATSEKQSLLSNAFEVLLKNLGPEKTTELWRVLTAPKEDYLNIRQRIFAGRNLASICKAAKKLNRK